MLAALNNPNVKAAVYAALGIALLCLMDAAIKHLVASNDFMIVVLGRYVFAALFAGLIWFNARQPKISAGAWRAHAARGCVIAVSAVTFFWALTVLPLVEVIVIAFVAPLMIPFVARLMIGERIRPRNIIAGTAGFAGVVMASLGAPVEEVSERRLLGVAAVLISAVTYAVSMTMLRARAGRDGPEIVGLLAAVIPGAIVAAPAVLTGAPPALSDLPAFVLLGLFGAGGMYCLAKAYAGAEAQVLAPIEYTALIWAALAGWLLFSEPVRPEVWMGAGVIIAACLWGAQEKRAAPHESALD